LFGRRNRVDVCGCHNRDRHHHHDHCHNNDEEEGPTFVVGERRRRDCC
jgi:hypothetical protein